MALSMALAKMSSRARQLVNRLCSIHRLPSEILSHIFSLVLKGYVCQNHPNLAHTFGPFAIGPPSDLLPLMAVCHRWRDTLVGCAKLWAVVDDQMPVISWKPSSYAPYLYRNPTGPLFVYVLTPQPCPDTFVLLRDSGIRVQELRVAKVDEKQLQQLAAFSADNLLACSLSDITPPYLPRALTLFKGHAPRLRALHLHSVHFIPCNNFQALAHLIIDFATGGQYDTSPHFTFPHLLAFLRGSPTLETMYFRDVGTQVMSHAPTGAAHNHPDHLLAALLCLRRLSVMHTTSTPSSIRFQSEIFTHLRIPPSCLIYVSPAEPSSLPSLMSAIHAGSTSRQLSSMALFDSGQMEDGDSSHLLLVNDQCREGVRIDIDCTLEAQTYRYPPDHDYVCRAMSSELFGRVRALHITSTSFAALMQPPCNAFRTLLLLERLVITRVMDTLIFTAPSEYLDDLHTVIALLAPQDPAHVPFPNLTGLGLPGIPVYQLAVVRDILKSRRDAGNPLRDLAVVLYRETATDGEWHDPQLTEEVAALVQTLTICDGVDDDLPLPEGFRWTTPADCTMQADDLSEFWPSWASIYDA